MLGHARLNITCLWGEDALKYMMREKKTGLEQLSLEPRQTCCTSACYWHFVFPP